MVRREVLSTDDPPLSPLTPIARTIDRVNALAVVESVVALPAALLLTLLLSRVGQKLSDGFRADRVSRRDQRWLARQALPRD